ncbi:MAG TPA: hypothetical protein VKO45_01200 [Methanomicrobiales archaeon]|nr:hypothetical protein [Methanomicrobiales archaeon]
MSKNRITRIEAKRDMQARKGISVPECWLCGSLFNLKKYFGFWECEDCHNDPYNEYEDVDEWEDVIKIL